MAMILQAIVTKFIGPTTHRGSRVKATAAAGHTILTWDSHWNPEQNHARVALKLAFRMKWNGKYVGGGMPDKSGYCWVNAGDNCHDPDFEVRGDLIFFRGAAMDLD